MSVEITRQFLLTAREEMGQALKEFGEKHGLKITVGHASYTAGVDGNATFKVELATQNESGLVFSKKSNDFLMNAERLGFLPEDLNKEFKYAGTIYKLIGFNPKSYKYPLVVERVRDGKQFKMPLEAANVLKTKTA